MSDLQPRGVAIEIGGVERHLLFTIAAIDELQAKYDKPLTSVMALLQDDDKVIDVTFDIMYILINDEIKRNNFFHHRDDATVTEQELRWLMDYTSINAYLGAIFKAYGISLPEVEDDDPNAESRSD